MPLIISASLNGCTQKDSERFAGDEDFLQFRIAPISTCVCSICSFSIFFLTVQLLRVFFPSVFHPSLPPITFPSLDFRKPIFGVNFPVISFTFENIPLVFPL